MPDKELLLTPEPPGPPFATSPAVASFKDGSLSGIDEEKSHLGEMKTHELLLEIKRDLVRLVVAKKKKELDELKAEAKKQLDELFAMFKETRDELIAELMAEVKTAKKKFDLAAAMAKKVHDECIAKAKKELDESIATAKEEIDDEQIATAKKAYDESIATAKKGLDEAETLMTMAKRDVIEFITKSMKAADPIFIILLKKCVEFAVTAKAKNSVDDVIAAIDELFAKAMKESE
jgi:Fe2+ transport system protein B